jgi:hypothetical protein
VSQEGQAGRNTNYNENPCRCIKISAESHNKRCKKKRWGFKDLLEKNAFLKIQGGLGNCNPDDSHLPALQLVA